MESTVVSISRTLAAGGEEIGRLVAGELGFRYVDDEIITKASEYAGVSPETVARVEQSQSLVGRILEAIEVGGILEASAVAPLPELALPEFEGGPVVPARLTYQNLIQRVIREAAQAGKVVFVAHGTSVPLADMSGLLRVLITASPTVRAERLMALTDIGERQAKKSIEDSDRERQNFFRRFYNLRQELPTLYDLVVNTDRFTVPEAVRLIVVASKR